MAITISVQKHPRSSNSEDQPEASSKKRRAEVSQTAINRLASTPAPAAKQPSIAVYRQQLSADETLLNRFETLAVESDSEDDSQPNPTLYV